MSGRDHSIECPRCGLSYGGLNGPDVCSCSRFVTPVPRDPVFCAWQNGRDTGRAERQAEMDREVEALRVERDALKVEVERLQRAQSNSTDRDYALMAEERDQAHDSETALRARVAELEAALRTYGRHEGGPDGCPHSYGNASRCTCGLDAALAPNEKS